MENNPKHTFKQILNNALDKAKKVFKGGLSFFRHIAPFLVCLAFGITLGLQSCARSPTAKAFDTSYDEFRVLMPLDNTRQVRLREGGVLVSRYLPPLFVATDISINGTILECIYVPEITSIDNMSIGYKFFSDSSPLFGEFLLPLYDLQGEPLIYEVAYVATFEEGLLLSSVRTYSVSSSESNTVRWTFFDIDEIEVASISFIFDFQVVAFPNSLVSGPMLPLPVEAGFADYYRSVYDAGYHAGINSQWGDISPLAAAGRFVTDILDIGVFGEVTLGHIFSIGFGFVLLGILIKVFLGG